MKTNLIFIHLFNDFSGSPRVLRDAIDAVQEYKEINRYNLHIITSRNFGFLSNANVKYHYVPYCTSKNKYIQLLRYFFSQIMLFFILSFMLISFRISGSKSIVIVNTLLPFSGHIAAKLFSNHNIAYIHETHIRPRLLMSFLKKIVSLCADTKIYVSKYVKEEINLKGGVSFVIYNGLRSDFVIDNFDPKSKFDRKQILFVGSLKKYKGVYSFVELASKLPEFNFVAALNAPACDFDLFSKNVVVSNFVALNNPSGLLDLYKNSMLVVNLSDPFHWVETFGLTLLEGISSGTPVVAPPYGGPLEFVDDKVGALIEPNRIDLVASFIYNIGNDFTSWEKKSNECLKRASSFSQSEYKKNIVGVINKISQNYW